MKLRLILLLTSLIATSAFADHYSGDPVPPATNKDGSIVTGVLTANFSPTSGGPFPNNLFFGAGGNVPDGTIDIPVDDPTNVQDPFVVLNALDGFSTTERWITTFIDDDGNPGSIDPGSVKPGQSVRVFQVKVVLGNPLAVTGIERELAPGVDYFATVANGNTLVILPLKPLPEYSSFMAVLTNDIKDTDGNDATPDQQYFLTQRQTSWLDENGNSVTPLLPNSTAQALEAIRPLTNLMEAAAESAGVVREDIILTWTVQTQSITSTLKALRSIAQPAPTLAGPTPVDTSALGGAGLADIYAGIITLPYYLGVPSAENPLGALNTPFQAEPGGYLPPFDDLGLDPTSTNVTIFNPFPVKTIDQTVPMLITVPNANSGRTKPAAGWPVVIFGHGIGGNRLQAVGVADTLAAAGFVVVAIDFPLHGISPDANPELAPFYVENTPLGAFADERTFDADYWNNATAQPGPDGLIDPPFYNAFFGALAYNLISRDALRQGIADLSVLALSISGIDLNADGLPDLDGSDIAYTGISWGAINGTAFTALEPLVTRSFLSVPGGGIARFVEGSDDLGPLARGFLDGLAGVKPGSVEYELFFTIWQTALDAGDPINWGRDAAAFTPVMLHEVLGDTVIPNFLLSAPLSGTEPLITAMGLTSYDSPQSSATGLRAVGRFVPPATHSSLGSPAAGSPEAFFEMQGQMASFIASGGGAINVANAATMQPVVQLKQLSGKQPKAGNEGGDKKPGRGGGSEDQLDAQRSKNPTE